MSPEQKTALIAQSQHLREMIKENASARYRKPLSSFHIVTKVHEYEGGEKMCYVLLVGSSHQKILVMSDDFTEWETIEGIHQALVDLFERVQNVFMHGFVEPHFSGEEEDAAYSVPEDCNGTA